MIKLQWYLRPNFSPANHVGIPNNLLNECNYRHFNMMTLKAHYVLHSQVPPTVLFQIHIMVFPFSDPCPLHSITSWATYNSAHYPLDYYISISFQFFEETKSFLYLGPLHVIVLFWNILCLAGLCPSSMCQWNFIFLEIISGHSSGVSLHCNNLQVSLLASGTT